ncbi:hypothetical protein HanPI659440_Chr11g0442051 [Helianthus annuus]|nr:hypothetical protein HanPI659440_Chr11g0442051 [Helianthus annuus]
MCLCADYKVNDDMKIYKKKKKKKKKSSLVETPPCNGCKSFFIFPDIS